MGKAFGIILLGGAAYLIYEMYFSTPAAASTSTVAAAGVPPTGTTYVPTTPAPNSVTTPTPVISQPDVSISPALASQIQALAGNGNYNLNQWMYFYQIAKGADPNNSASFTLYGTAEEEAITQSLGLNDTTAGTTIITLQQFLNALSSNGLSGLSGLGGLGLFGEMMYNRQGVSHPIFGYHN